MRKKSKISTASATFGSRCPQKHRIIGFYEHSMTCHGTNCRARATKISKFALHTTSNVLASFISTTPVYFFVRVPIVPKILQKSVSNADSRNSKGTTRNSSESCLRAPKLRLYARFLLGKTQKELWRYQSYQFFKSP